MYFPRPSIPKIKHTRLRKMEKPVADGWLRKGPRAFFKSQWTKKPRSGGYLAEGNEGPAAIPVIPDIAEVKLAAHSIADEVRRVQAARLRVTPETVVLIRNGREIPFGVLRGH